MILLYGDSLAGGLVVNTPFHTESFPGATTEQLLTGDFDLSFYLNEENYRVVIIVLGTNDLGHLVDWNDVLDNLMVLHQTCWNKGVKTIAVGVRDNKFNKKLKKRLHGHVLYKYCGFLEDVSKKYMNGIHLTQKGKVLFQEELNRCIEKLI